MTSVITSQAEEKSSDRNLWFKKNGLGMGLFELKSWIISVFILFLLKLD